MFDWIDSAVDSAKKTWNEVTGGSGAGSSSPKKQEAAKSGGYAEQEKALSPNGSATDWSKTSGQAKAGSSASGTAKAGGGSWWDKLWGDDKKDEGPVSVPMKTEEPPEPDKEGPSHWEQEQKRKQEHNRKVSAWKEYERERQIIRNKLEELRSRKGFLQRNPHSWSADYILQQEIQVRQEEDKANAEMAALKEPPYKRPEPYDYYVGV